MRVFTFLLTLLTFALPAHASWRHTTDHRGNSQVFSQFKYFAFYSEDLSGHIAYVQLAPEKINKFYVMGNFIIKGVQHTMFQSVDGECVLRSAKTMTVDVCGRAGIWADTADGLRVYNHFGNIQWDFQIAKSADYGRIKEINASFWDSPFYERLIGFALGNDWSLGWRALDLDMRSKGVLTIGAKSVAVNDVVTYHDDTWGNWNFITQPYFWLFFNSDATPSKEQGKSKVTVLVGDFYRHRLDRMFGIQVLVDGQELRYRPGEYRVAVEERAAISEIPYELLGEKESYTVTTLESLKSGKRSHDYPSRISLTTHDGKVHVTATVRDITPYSPKLPLQVQKVLGSNWNDDMVVDVVYEITGSDGKIVRGKTIGGMEFFQNKRAELPSVIE